MSDTPFVHPAPDDHDAWQAFWTARGEPWRTEPEISAERQRALAERRDTVKPDIKKGIYPCKDVRLSRADIEWLLHKHKPIDWRDETQRYRDGLDVRGALFNKTSEHEETDFSGLPLARIRFGLNFVEWVTATTEQREQAAAQLEWANFYQAHLEGASLRAVHLAGANCYQAHLEGAHLDAAHLERADLTEAHLRGASLGEAHLEGASLNAAHLETATLIAAHLEGATLTEAHLEGVDLTEAHLEGADLTEAHLEGADLGSAHLESTLLSDADYQRIQAAKHEFGIMVPQQLPPTNLRLAFFNEATTLNDLTLGNGVQCAYLADVRWGGVNLAVIPWNAHHITVLGDEVMARTTKNDDGTKKAQADRIRAWEAAVRAYRQLAVTLRAQGMNEIADRFAYRAQLCQRRVLRLQHSIGSYLWSGFLDVLAGYGYVPLRTVILYLFVILGFTLAYMQFGMIDGHSFHFDEAVVYSLTAFHGRGFFPGSLKLDDPIVKIASGEAVIGLVIEISFIATFTQRFFSR